MVVGTRCLTAKGNDEEEEENAVYTEGDDLYIPLFIFA
jgi:hypothetical protein